MLSNTRAALKGMRYKNTRKSTRFMKPGDEMERAQRSQTKHMKLRDQQRQTAEGKGIRVQREARSRLIRDELLAGLEKTTAPYTVPELMDMVNNPNAPSEMRLPPHIVEMLVKVEKQSHVGKPINATSLASSFAARVRTTKVTPSARRLVDSEAHSDEASQHTVDKHQNQSFIAPFEVAPVNYSSTKAKHLFARNAKVEVTHICAEAAEFPVPDTDLPEVAFIGIENRGKSALINCLANRHLVEVGDDSGTTREVHFINAANSLRIVDVPGWVQRRTRGTHNQDMQRLNREYIRQRSAAGILKRAVVVVDGAMGLDYMTRILLRMLSEHEVPFVTCVTRTDQYGRGHMVRMVSLLESELEDYPTSMGVHLTTTVQKLGISRLQNDIAEVARIAELGHVLKKDFSIRDILPAVGYEKTLLSTIQKGNQTPRERRRGKLAESVSQA